jgi:hypothetical protein
LIQRPQEVTFRPLSAGEVIGQTIEAYRRLWRQLAPIPLVLIVPVYAAGLIAVGVFVSVVRRIHEVHRHATTSLVFSGPKSSYVAPLIVLGILLVAYWLAQLVMSAAVAVVVAQGYVGAPPRWRSALALAWRRLGSIVWATLLLGLALAVVFVVGALIAVLLGATPVGGLAVLPVIALIVGAVWVGVSECVIVAVVLFEPRRGFEALRRSFALVRGRWWPTLGVLLTVGLLTTIATSLVQTVIRAVLPGSAALVVTGTLIGSTLAVVLTPLVPIAVACIYFDTRNRKEGVDLDEVALQIGVPAGERGTVGTKESPTEWGRQPGWHGGAGARTPYPPPAPPAWPPPPNWPAAPGYPPPQQGYPPPQQGYPPPQQGYPPPQQGYPPPEGYPPPGYPPPSQPPFPGQQPPPPSGVWGDVVPPSTPQPVPPWNAPPTVPQVPVPPPPPPAPPGTALPPEPTPQPDPMPQPGAAPPPPAVWPAISPKPPAPRSPWSAPESGGAAETESPSGEEGRDENPSGSS